MTFARGAPRHPNAAVALGTPPAPLAVADYNRRLNIYLSLLRHNRNFRLLFFGQAISQLGDWFNAVAVYALLLDLTGSATAVAWMMVVQFPPIAIVGPVAGVVG